MKRSILYISILAAVLAVSATANAAVPQADSNDSGEYTVDIFKEAAMQAASKSRVTMPMSGDAGKVFMITFPFKVSSYYFGPDAKVYQLSSIPSVSATTGAYTIKVRELDIDRIEELPVSKPLLIKCSHTETEIKATRNLFKENMVSVTPEVFSEDISGGESGTTYCTVSSDITYKSVWEPGGNATYVLDGGFLKRVNSSDYKVPACRAVITNSDAYADASVSMERYSDGTADIIPLLISHAAVKPLMGLNGYVSFYNETSDFEICEAENGNPGAKVYTVVKSTSGDGEGLALHEVTDGIIQKGSAVLVNARTDGNDLKLRMVTNGSTDMEAYTANILRGVTVDTPVSDLCDGGEDCIYALGRNNDQFAIAFQQYGKENTLAAYRAYIKASDLPDGRAYYTLSGDPTGIHSVKNGDDADVRVYDLNGMEVKDARYSGVYIVNNKKVVVK